jgi:hypothetical protein
MKELLELLEIWDLIRRPPIEYMVYDIIGGHPSQHQSKPIGHPPMSNELLPEVQKLIPMNKKPVWTQLLLLAWGSAKKPSGQCTSPIFSNMLRNRANQRTSE